MDFQVAKPDKPLNSIIFNQENPDCYLFEKDGILFISGCKTQKEADDLLAAHNPPKYEPPTIEQKLASVGLNLDDLKAALGL